jgi:hypothetical protein
MMKQYKWYFLDHVQRTAAAEFVACKDDDDAKRKAAEILAERKYHGIEIWDGRRRVHCLNADRQDFRPR